MNKINEDLKLLPPYFRIISFVVMVTSFLIVIIPFSKITGIEKELIKVISENGILLSLLFLALTRNKVEDELTFRIRLKALASSFIYGVTIVIISPFTKLFFHRNSFTNKGVTELLLSMFLFYFIIFYILKKRR